MSSINRQHPYRLLILVITLAARLLLGLLLLLLLLFLLFLLLSLLALVDGREKMRGGKEQMNTLSAVSKQAGFFQLVFFVTLL